MKLSHIVLILFAAASTVFTGCTEQQIPTFEDESAHAHAAYVLRNVYEPLHPDYKKQLSEALATLDGLIKKYPREAKYYATRAYAKQTLAEYESADIQAALEEEADKDIAKALSLDKEVKELFYHFVEEAETADKEQKVLKRYIEKYPDYIAPYGVRATMNIFNDDLKEQTLSDLNKAIELEPHNSEHYATRAYYYIVHTKPRTALGDAEKAMQLGDKGDSMHFIRGLALGDSGRHAEAVQEFDAFLSCPIKMYGFTTAMGYSFRARSYLWLGDFGKAIADAKTALESEDTLSNFKDITYETLIHSLEAAGDKEGMMRTLNEFRQKYPDSRFLKPFENY